MRRHCGLAPFPMFDDEQPKLDNKVNKPLKEEQEKSPQDEQVHTMPMEYYLGDKTVSATKGSKGTATASKPSNGAPKHKKSKLGVILIMVILAILVLASIGLLVYTYIPSSEDNQNQVVFEPQTVDPVVDQDDADEPQPDELDTEEPADDPVDDVLPDNLVPAKEFDYSYANRFNVNVMASVDSDNDGLTDQEELLINTNATIADSDGDGYADGSELMNFYSPTQSMVKLEEGDFVAEYENTMYSYKLLYPKSWLADSLDPLDTEDVLFTSSNNEFVNVFIANKNSEESIVDWYLRLNPRATRTQLKFYNNHYDIPVIESPDGFTVFIAKQDMVYVINYGIGQKVEAFYPAMFKMMVDSFNFIEGDFAEAPVAPDEPIDNVIACTEEAKICPDGSSVGRTGPDCEFAACP